MMNNDVRRQRQFQPRDRDAPAAVCLGAVAPASMTYARLAEALSPTVRVITKDLECFAEAPPDTYTLESEMDGLIRTTEAAGIDRFHLLGYSVGGSLALVFALAHPDRITSLTLIEPAWIGNAIESETEAKFLSDLDHVMEVPPPARGPALFAAVEPPFDGAGPVASLSPPAWLSDRAARFEFIWSALRNTSLNLAALRNFKRPLYLPVGGRSHPRFMLAARQLATLCPTAVIGSYPGSSHLDPPHVAETDRFVANLCLMWRCAS